MLALLDNQHMAHLKLFPFCFTSLNYPSDAFHYYPCDHKLQYFHTQGLSGPNWLDSLRLITAGGPKKEDSDDGVEPEAPEPFEWPEDI